MLRIREGVRVQLLDPYRVLTKHRARAAGERPVGGYAHVLTREQGYAAIRIQAESGVVGNVVVRGAAVAAKLIARSLGAEEVLPRGEQSVKWNRADLCGNASHKSPRRPALQVVCIRRDYRPGRTVVIYDFDKLVAGAGGTVKPKLREHNPGTPVGLGKSCAGRRKTDAHDKRCQYRET